MRFVTLSAAVVSTVAVLGTAVAPAASAASSTPGQVSPNARHCVPHPDPNVDRWIICHNLPWASPSD